MTILDILIGILLLIAMYKGLKKGLFLALASFVSLIIGIFIAIKCSYMIRFFIAKQLSWSPKHVEIVAFGLTFLAVVLGICFLAKVFTSIADFAYLGWLNKLGGAFFNVLKTTLMLSVLINLFQKININNYIVSQKTLSESMFYYPIQEVSNLIYPSIQKSFDDFKKTTTKNTNS